MFYRGQDPKQIAKLAEYDFLADKELLLGEIPSTNGVGSAEGMAKIAALMAGKGKFEHVRLLSEETWKKFHDCADVKKDALLLVKSKFCQGGVNLFDADQEILAPPPLNNNYGNVGWTGYGTIERFSFLNIFFVK